MAEKRKRRWVRNMAVGALTAFGAAAVFMGLILTKRIRVNDHLAARYQVDGVDVSHHQGVVDWAKMEEQGVEFAFIKATEGSSHVDSQFSANWDGVAETDILAGAYHFYSFDSAAGTQSQLFIDTVGGLGGKLPPVIDVEYYGDKKVNPPEKDAVVTGIKEMLDALEAEYHVKPLLYTTYPVYFRYLKGSFEEYPLWIRNVYFEPGMEMGEEWMFWQYSDTDVMDGYGGSGNEKCIDRNVFAGDLEVLRELVVE